jgi:hypothetical protein
MLLFTHVSQYTAAIAAGRERLSRSRPRLFRLSKGRFIACSLALIGLLQIAAWFDGGLSRQPAADHRAAAPRQIWTGVLHKAEVFRLDAPEFAGQPRSYRALQDRTGGGRQDVLELGGDGDAAPNFRLVIYRPGSETVPNQSFFVELARRAAETGRAISRMTQPDMVATKFGDFEVSELLLAWGRGPPRECLGFRFAATAPDLRIDGFACGALQSAPYLPPKAGLACLIDSLELVAPPEDEQLVWFFAAHERTGHSPCQGPPPVQRAGRAAVEQIAALGLRGAGSE